MTSADAVTHRILSTFPAGHYGLEGFLRMVEVRLTNDVPTAAVECRIMPALLLNPAFLEAHCRTDEHLLVLVLHEIHHVLLGHTRLFPRVTPAQNIAFDAVINALIARQFPQDHYLSFFRDYYPADRFPECILRPPDGWPLEPRYPAGLPKKYQRLIRTIYSDAGATYAEIFERLGRDLGDGGEIRAAAGRLLGDHAPEEDAPGRGQDAYQAPALLGTVRAVVEKWPQPPDPIRGRSLGVDLRENIVPPAAPPPGAVQILRRAIQALVSPDRHGQGRLARADLQPVPLCSPIPALADRGAMVRRALGQTPLLYFRPSTAGRAAAPGVTEVFLDVSGSVAKDLPHLAAALVPFARRGQIRLWAFSEKVVALTRSALEQGNFPTTGGTDIACVTAEITARKIRKALVVTDGYVGKIPPDHQASLRRHGARLWVALTAPGFLTDLEHHVERIVQLPPVSRG